MSILLLNTAYFPPIQYFSEIKRHEQLCIEQYENYGKQSYRNRCIIQSANGAMPLVVPVKKTGEIKFLTKEAQIDYSCKWQKLHFKSIESAYKNSPFYDYYIEDLLGFFEHQEKYLLDLNNQILLTFLSLLDLKREIHSTSDYITDTNGFCDYREIIHPKPSRRKAMDTDFRGRPYTQTFNDRFPFMPNLSILDLLFNTGPEASDYL